MSSHKYIGLIPPNKKIKFRLTLILNLTQIKSVVKFETSIAKVLYFKYIVEIYYSHLLAE